MTDIITKLQAAGQQHKGTDLGGLLQWAALHIANQDEAIAELREGYSSEEAAAPELLAALQALVGWEEAEIKHFGATGPDAWIMEMARAAIAKATT